MLISHSSNARFRIDVFCFCCCFEFFRTILPWLFTLRACEHTRARCCSAIVRFLTFQHSFFRSSQPYKCAGVHDSQTACVLMHSAIEYVWACYDIIQCNQLIRYMAYATTTKKNPQISLILADWAKVMRIYDFQNEYKTMRARTRSCANDHIGTAISHR